jgi:glycosyltransferase involved in cell wall biosynthesis
MSKLHILFIASWYPSPKNPTHGIFNRLFVSAAALHARVSVLFVSPDEHHKKGYDITSGEEENIFTVRVVYPGSPSRRSLINKVQQYKRRIRAAEKGFDVIRTKQGIPDLVQLNVVLPAGPASLYLCKKYKLPLVVNEGWTGYAPEDGRYKGFITTFLTRKVIAGAKRILPVTNYLSEQMQKHGLTGNYTVVPNVVDTSVFYPAETKRDHGPFRFIHVSALDDEQKNVSGILNAFAQVLEKTKHIELIIAGDGDDAGSLKKLSSKLGIQNQVRFVGTKDPAGVSELFREADALVMFSNYETFCVVIPEALACGIPVITSDAGGVMSYFNKSLGLVVPMRDEQALSDAMNRFADKGITYNVEALRSFVESHFSKQVVSEKLMNVYNSVLRE